MPCESAIKKAEHKARPEKTFTSKEEEKAKVFLIKQELCQRVA